MRIGWQVVALTRNSDFTVVILIFTLRRRATRCGCLLLRILHRFFAATSRRPIEQFVGDLVGVVLAADGDAVADPLADCELRVGLRPLDFAGGRIQTLDDVTLYDEPFDQKSFLVQVLGIPEPTSLTVLTLGALLLARRRRVVQRQGPPTSAQSI